jgi:hypothetical protein
MFDWWHANKCKQILTTSLASSSSLKATSSSPYLSRIALLFSFLINRVCMSWILFFS